MIVVSLLFITVAVVLLGFGLAGGSDMYLLGSVAASLLAALALVVAGRRASAERVYHGDGDDADGETGVDGLFGADPGPGETVLGDPAAGAASVSDPAVAQAQTRPGAAGTSDSVDAPVATVIPTQGGAPDHDSDESLADEPAVQLTAPSEAAAVLRSGAIVQVVDGRPRYHLDDCPHLQGRPAESIEVREAVDLGFSPCARCEPDSAIVSGARLGA